jgi:hypothetical protein
MRATKSQEKENQAPVYYYDDDFPRFLVNFLGSRRRRRPTTKRHISINNGHPQEPTTTSQKRNIETEIGRKKVRIHRARMNKSRDCLPFYDCLMCRLYYIVNGGEHRTIYHVDVARFLPSSPTTTPWLLQWKRHLYMYRPHTHTHTTRLSSLCVCVSHPRTLLFWCFRALCVCVCVW